MMKPNITPPPHAILVAATALIWCIIPANAGLINCNRGLPCLPAMDSVGVGFDVVKGTSAGYPPVINFTYDKNNVYSPPSWASVPRSAYPDQFTLLPGQSGSQTKQDVFRSKDEFMASQKTSIGLDAHFKDANGTFKMDAGARLARGWFRSSSHVGSVVSTQTTRTVYGIQINPPGVYNPTNPPHRTDVRPTSDLQNHANRLPPSFNSSTQRDYFSFLETFGTHYVSHATVGGRGKMFAAVGESYTKSSDDTTLKFQADCVFDFIKKGGKATTPPVTTPAPQKKKTTTVTTTTVTTTTRPTQCGGHGNGNVTDAQINFRQCTDVVTNVDGGNPADMLNWPAWQETLYQAPALVDYRVTPLSKLVAAVNPTLAVELDKAVAAKILAAGQVCANVTEKIESANQIISTLEKKKACIQTTPFNSCNCTATGVLDFTNPNGADITCVSSMCTPFPVHYTMAGYKWAADVCDFGHLSGPKQNLCCSKTVGACRVKTWVFAYTPYPVPIPNPSQPYTPFTSDAWSVNHRMLKCSGQPVPPPPPNPQNPDECIAGCAPKGMTASEAQARCCSKGKTALSKCKGPSYWLCGPNQTAASNATSSYTSAQQLSLDQNERTPSRSSTSDTDLDINGQTGLFHASHSSDPGQCNSGCVPKGTKRKAGQPLCCSGGKEELHKCEGPAYYHCGPNIEPPSPPSPPTPPSPNAGCGDTSGIMQYGNLGFGLGFEALNGFMDGKQKPTFTYKLLADWTCNNGKKYVNPYNTSTVSNIPDQVHIADTTYGESAIETRVSYTAASYVKNLALDIGMDVPVEEGVTFQAAIKVANENAFEKPNFGSFATAQRKIEKFTATLAPPASLKLEKGFSSRIQDLESKCPTYKQQSDCDKLYRAFLSDFGTHYVTSATFGGLAQVETQVSADYTNKYSSTAIGIQVGLTFEDLVSASAEFGTTFTKASDEFVSKSTSTTVCMGGNCPSWKFPDPFKDWDKWVDSLNEVAVQTRFTVARISNLVKWMHPGVASSIDNALMLLPEYGFKWLCNAEIEELDGAQGKAQSLESEIQCHDTLQSKFSRSGPAKKVSGFPQRQCIAVTMPRCGLSNGKKCTQDKAVTFGTFAWGFCKPGTTPTAVCSNVGDCCTPDQYGRCSAYAKKYSGNQATNIYREYPIGIKDSAMNTCIGVVNCTSYIYNND